MADPITIGLLSTAGAAGAAASSVALPVAATAIAASGAVKTVMDYQAAEAQQKALNRQAGEVEGAAEIRAGQRMREAMAFRGQQRAATAASGVDLTGSPALITAETLASAAAESDAERRVAGAQAEGLRAQGRAANRAGKIGLATNIIGTVGSLAMLGVQAGLKAPPQGPVTAAPSGPPTVQSGIFQGLAAPGTWQPYDPLAAAGRPMGV